MQITILMFLVLKGGLLLFIKNHNIQAFLYKLIDKVGAKNYLIQNIQKKFGQLNQLKRMGYLCQIHDSFLYVP